MIGFDTNVLVRYIMQDDAKQSPKATKLLESLTVDKPGFVSIVSVIELAWVLESCYSLTRQQVGLSIDLLLRTKEIVVDRAEQIAKALWVFQSGRSDFADCLIEQIGAKAGCSKTMTFDLAASKQAGMVLI